MIWRGGARYYSYKSHLNIGLFGTPLYTPLLIADPDLANAKSLVFCQSGLMLLVFYAPNPRLPM
jgi:hypothetical protein